MKKLLSILIIIILICSLASCSDAEEGTYEVISVATYTVITGSDSNGPITETRLGFIYMDNGEPKMKSNYYENTSSQVYGDYIIIGDTNKYVVVVGYRTLTEYLYLTQATYDSLFSE